jgi:hypothetical protein
VRCNGLSPTETSWAFFGKTVPYEIQVLAFSVHPFIHSFSSVIEYHVCAKHCVKSQENSKEQNNKGFLSSWSFL